MIIDTETIGESSRRARKSGAPTHVLILAGGDGARLRPVTRVLAGDDRPKQFCALVGSDPLLVQTERRAALVAPRGQVFVSLTRPHERWYRDMISGIPPASLVVQPQNRGTATAVLYGLLRIARRVPDASVVVMPSDHWVSSDSAFMLHVQAAVGIVEAHPDAVVLLGVEPTRPESEFGWIARGEPVIESWRGFSRVAGFVEKPPADRAAELLAARASLWNTAVVAGRLQQLLLLFSLAQPALVDDFLSIWSVLGSRSEQAAVDRLYADLPTRDLSRDVLTPQPESLSVLEVRGVGWEDLGRPAGILEARRSTSAAGSADALRRRREVPRLDCA